ncbi:Protein kinase family protein [Rhynchospora pubera]|uniref:non-specific serine/threonine protein kinase n=1 Tax=Rhynchospora pubera TaxID=906938 RepID=A0AAV8EWI4_9POAL|nr:Protein kinase family protein [Rhynchospora pubera]
MEKQEKGGNKRVSFDPGKELESPRFRAIIRATSGRKKRGDVKSFSHELNVKEHHQLPMRKLRGATNIDELMNVIKVKFSRLKQEVNSELCVYGGDLICTLERIPEEHPDRTHFEDLLVIAQKCEAMPPDEFWLKCEGIVQTLDDQRQDLPMGILKQAHTRILFILTRCTRLLQFQKEGAFGEDERALALHQLSDLGVYSSAQGNSGELGKKKVLTANDIKERLIRRRIIENRHQSVDFMGRPLGPYQPEKDNLSPESRDRISSWKKLPSAAEKKQRKDEPSPTKKVLDSIANLNRIKVSREEIEERIKTGEAILGYGDDHQGEVVSERHRMICRICEFEIPTEHAANHNKVCTIAYRCDAQGLSLDKRLHKVADILEKILAAFRTHKSLDVISEESEEVSSPEIGTPNQVSGSATPQSPMMTPTTTQANQLLDLDRAFTELENFQQIDSLLNITRGIESIESNDYNSLEDLSSYLEDLNAVIDTRKVDALVVDTFGKRIAKLLQEKFIQLCGDLDESQKDPSYPNGDDDSFSDNSVSHSARATNMNARFKDRTTIEDFEILKPISRGAFGRVFLAKKRVTGDLFAIKVLKKADMIRKNAVESILAERNILISARNPFMVRFFYSFTCRENLYLVMEYLNGGDLYSLLRNLGCLDEDMARMYIAEVVLALEYLHSLNVIHRDLKPDNLLISRDGHIKLTDFGLSKVGLINSTDDLSGPDVSGALMGEQEEAGPGVAAQRAEKREQRRKQTAVGTPDYLAPEILLGMPHGPTADWWSVGIILFELLVGIPPFNAEHPQRIFDNIMNRDIPWPQVPEEMSIEAYDLIDKLLSENPLQRLGATGAGEVKAHPFFKDVNWDMLARQKATFIPSTEDEYDTSYFESRHPWGASGGGSAEQMHAASNGYDDISDSSSCCSSPISENDEEVDECGSMEDFSSRTISVSYSFSNFSFKNISQLASMNYDLMKQNATKESASTS